MRRSQLSSTIRAGSVSSTAMIVLPVLILILVGVISLALLRGSKTELQTSGDAAALAAARVLADDGRLTSDLNIWQTLLTRARVAALDYAVANPVHGKIIELDLNSQNRPDGDVVFGHLTRPLGGQFERFNPDEPGDVLRVNAVRISARRSSDGDPLEVRATAYLDFAAVGLRPMFDKPLPLVPVALYSCRGDGDPFAERGWECQPRQDAFRYDAELRRWVPGEDGIPELAVVLGEHDPDHPSIQGMPLQIGTRTVRGFLDQIRDGVAPAALAGPPFQGELVLNDQRRLAIPGVESSDDTDDEEPLETLARTFRLLAADSSPRIWPLFQDLRDDDQVIVCGFAAVRIVKVEVEEGRVRVLVQPAVLSSPTVVTDSDRPPPNALWGATLCRIRLAE